MQKNKLVKVVFSEIANYEEILKWQNRQWQGLVDGESEQVLWLGQHESTITCGRASDKTHVLADAATLKESKTQVVDIDRGGDVTWHGPGQLVGYPIIDLNNFKPDLKWFLSELENVLIDTLQTYSVEAFTIEGKTGVWVKGESESEKIACLGIHVSRWIAKHGFSLNVSPDLSFFKMINPCGLGCEVSSLKKILGDACPSVEEVSVTVAQKFKQRFLCEEVVKT